MKKIKSLLIIITMLIILPISVSASGSIAPSTRSLSITKGGTATFTISANNAVGKVDISSSNSGIATVNRSSEWLENNSITVTVSGISAGTTTINVRLSDAATFDEEELSGNYSITVTVNEPSSNNNNNKPSNNNNNNRPSNNNNNTNNNNKLSSNNNVKDLKIEGYDLIKVDNHNYELIVNNNVEKIKVNCSAEDSKAKVTGTGEHELKVGENKIEVTITSESGSKNNINIKVTRKDGYYLEDLESVLNDSNIKDAGIIVNEDGKITKDNLEEIKKSKKTLTFNYYNEEKTLIYSWTIDGSKVKNTKDLLTTITFVTDNIEKISELSNYADGIYLNFSHNGTLPEGTKVKIFVGDKFKDKTKVNLYHFDKEESSLNSIEEDLTVKDGYIEFDIKHCSEYFITRSDLGAMQNNNYLIGIIAIVELIIIIAIIVLDILKINPLLKLKKDTIKKTLSK